MTFGCGVPAGGSASVVKVPSDAPSLRSCLGLAHAPKSRKLPARTGAKLPPASTQPKRSPSSRPTSTQVVGRRSVSRKRRIAHGRPPSGSAARATMRSALAFALAGAAVGAGVAVATTGTAGARTGSSASTTAAPTAEPAAAAARARRSIIAAS